MRKFVVAAVLMAAGAAGYVAAEEGAADASAKAKADALALIDKAKKALEGDRAQEAVDLLQKAVDLVQRNMLQGLADFLPQMEGWKREKPEVNSGSWTADGETFQWNTAVANYRKGDQSIQLTLSTSPQMVETYRQMAAAFREPQMRAMMLQADPSMSFIDEDGWFGVISGQGRGSGYVVGDKIIVNVDAPNADLARQALKAIDRKALNAAIR